MHRCPTCHRRLRPAARCPLHPAPAPLAGEPAAPPPLPELAGLSHLALLGAGGFARVYAARRGAAAVAVKLALRAGDPRFPREGAALRRLGAAVAPALLDEGVSASGHPYLIMELVPGAPLAEWLADQPAAVPEPGPALRIFRALCGAVDQVHAAGLVHRDLKPENIIVRDPDQVTLLDFGLARARGDGEDGGELALTTTGQRLGTPAYMAPEQCVGQALIDHRADLYALGVILFELLTGRPPFVGDATEVEQAHLSRRPPRTGLADAVDEVLARALAKEPAQRPASAAELADAITAAAVVTAAPREVTAAPRPADSARRQVALLGVQGRLDAPEVVEVIAAERGQIARAAEGWYVVAFPDAASLPGGLRAALRTAARFAGRVTLSVVHAAELRVRERLLLGRAIDDHAAWTPAAATAAPLLLTDDAAAALGSEAVHPADVAGFHVLTSAGPPSTAGERPLFGRDALVRQLVAEAQGAGLPALAALTGETGLGKTRVLEALARALRHAGATVLEVTDGEDDGPLRRLTLAAFGWQAPPAAAEIRDAVGGHHPAPARAVAQALGVGDTTGPDAPGALRQSLASALGQALRRLAEAGPAPLAILVDDVQRADPVIIDALEIAALAEHRAPLWVLVAGEPSFFTLRPEWGARAARDTRHELAPLDDAAAALLLGHHLKPAEYIPGSVLAAIQEMTHGVPRFLVEVAGELRAAGAVRRLRGTESFFLAGDDLLHLSATPLAERLAQRALAALPAEQRGLARLCAVLGEDFAIDELEQVRAQLAAGDAGQLDAGFGLDSLCRHGVLRTSDGRTFRFRAPLLCAALESLLPAGERRRLAAAAYAGLRQGPQARRARLARHAAVAGERQAAARLYLELADDAARRQRLADAERHCTAALAALDQVDPGLREQALARRGRLRHRVRRLSDALADLRGAFVLAEARGDAAAMADLLLDEATALDGTFDFAGSAAAVARARHIGDGLGDPVLVVRLLQAEARTHWRHERVVESIELHVLVADQAARLDLHETRVAGLLLLAPALVYNGSLDEAERRYEEVIALCERAGDLFHLGTAYCNRLMLWLKRHRYQNAIDDAQRAIALAREIGNVQIERMTQYNLAELLLWFGRLDEALPAAERAHELFRRFFSDPWPEDALLIARIRAARGEVDAARELAAWIRARCPPGQLPASLDNLLRAVDLCCAGGAADEDWAALLERVRAHSLLDEHLEILWLRICAARRDQRPVQEAESLHTFRALTSGSPIWAERLAGVSS